MSGGKGRQEGQARSPRRPSTFVLRVEFRACAMSVPSPGVQDECDPISAVDSAVDLRWQEFLDAIDAAAAIESILKRLSWKQIQLMLRREIKKVLQSFGPDCVEKVQPDTVALQLLLKRLMALDVKDVGAKARRNTRPGPTDRNRLKCASLSDIAAAAKQLDGPGDWNEIVAEIEKICKFL